MQHHPPGSDGGAEEPREVSAVVSEYCACFNRGEFFEAHEILETLWLPVRRTPEGELWKGLIQLAAAFVHVQKGRSGPALSLLKSARDRLATAAFPVPRIDLASAVRLACDWETALSRGTIGPLGEKLRKSPPLL